MCKNVKLRTLLNFVVECIFIQSYNISTRHSMGGDISQYYVLNLMPILVHYKLLLIYKTDV